eukprot:PhM_4_TR6753/c0_g1_i3/m.16805
MERNFDPICPPPRDSPAHPCALCGRMDVPVVESVVCSHMACRTCALARDLRNQTSCPACHVRTYFAPNLPYMCGFQHCTSSFDSHTSASAHMLQCPQRKLRCRNCGSTMSIGEVAMHSRTCRPGQQPPPTQLEPQPRPTPYEELQRRQRETIVIEPYPTSRSRPPPESPAYAQPQHNNNNMTAASGRAGVRPATNLSAQQQVRQHQRPALLSPPAPIRVDSSPSVATTSASAQSQREEWEIVSTPPDSPQQHVPAEAAPVAATTTPISPSTSSPASSWETITAQSIRKGRKINEGAQGSIWECTVAGQPGNYAVKYIHFPTLAEAERNYAMTSRLRRLRNDHLIRYYSTLLDRGTCEVMIVMQLYEEENLGFLIRQRSLVSIEEQSILSFGLQCAKALEYLHGQNIVHCDVKPENILMFDGQTRLVLTDLESIRDSPFPASQGEGTFAWSAPEFVNGGTVTTSADIWSLGVVLFVLARLPDYPAITVKGEECVLNCAVFSDDAVLRDGFTRELASRGYGRKFIELLVAMTSHTVAKRPKAFALCEMVTEIMTSNLLGD